MKKNYFYLKLDSNYFNKGDVIEISSNSKGIIVNTPNAYWYRKLFRFISFGLYKIPTEYKCKILK